MREGGLIEQFYQQQKIEDKDGMNRLLKKNQMNHSTHSTKVSNIQNLMGAFMFLGIGLTGSAVVFVLEWLQAKCS